MTWSPPTWDVAATAALGLLLAVGVPFIADTPGRVLLAGAAVLLLGSVLRDLVARPRLAADADGVVVRRLTGTTRRPWGAVRVRVREVRRLGLRGGTLELDGSTGPDDDGPLVVLGRRDLGTAPASVARALRALDPTGG
ncbi:PH domain-containing protein [Blastococcus tunisiensis]|uniref:PH domain-containing protein n=1 Tax=Blastococcus tunisiensis TaxID=1798228 RepID=A0A1I2FNI1_9ACTN|nr:PH domain-containing protein [Blastococcus sp. DSM 46838]SFF06150.1 PH domain-containing protein [Blastococcus sp. DSM 46838]